MENNELIYGLTKEQLNDISAHYLEIMKILGIKGEEEIANTPMRVAKSLAEQTSTLRLSQGELLEEMTGFSLGVPYDLEQTGIPFSSMCAHHHLPFFGFVDIEVDSQSMALGLSKFKRIVDIVASTPNTQEEFTYNLVNAINHHIRGRADRIKVTVRDTTHTCMACRGVSTPGISTKTVREYNSTR